MWNSPDITGDFDRPAQAGENKRPALLGGAAFSGEVHFGLSSEDEKPRTGPNEAQPHDEPARKHPSTPPPADPFFRLLGPPQIADPPALQCSEPGPLNGVPAPSLSSRGSPGTLPRLRCSGTGLSGTVSPPNNASATAREIE